MTLVLSELNQSRIEDTPFRLVMTDVVRDRLQSVAELADAMGKHSGVTTRVAYSIKTDPDPALVDLARSRGLMAEAISQAEARFALRQGWRASEIVLNGPGKWWPERETAVGPGDVAAWFADSVEELETVIGAHACNSVGLRVRPPGVESRFGVEVADLRTYGRLVKALRSGGSRREIGIHFHHAASDIGVADWSSSARQAVAWAEAIERDSRGRVTTLDLGGGWFPDDLGVEATKTLSEVAKYAAHQLTNLREVIIEPGKALSQPAKALVVSVLEVRSRAHGQNELVVDGSIADLSQARSYPHRLFRSSSGGWRQLGYGTGRVLGRICMEQDVLAWDVAIPSAIRTGDRLAIVDSGAYDDSMSYTFGSGR